MEENYLVEWICLAVVLGAVMLLIVWILYYLNGTRGFWKLLGGLIGVLFGFFVASAIYALFAWVLGFIAVGLVGAAAVSEFGFGGGGSGGGGAGRNW